MEDLTRIRAQKYRIPGAASGELILGAAVLGVWDAHCRANGARTENRKMPISGLCLQDRRGTEVRSKKQLPRRRI